ncbi:MAG: MIP family channel protein [Euryarchaeota archaeon]|nr:MIP family channel protein [Euryarchaeota archaeon]
MQRYLAEFIGTFILVFAGTGAIVINDLNGGVISHIGISLTFGLAVLIVVCAIGHISGAHINPAVTIAFAVNKRFPISYVPPYLVAQLLGAISASFLVFLLFGNISNLGGTFPMNGNVTQSLVLEFVLTFILMFVIIAVATDERVHESVAGPAIGLTVAMDALLGGPISGGSMNPARSFGPALVGINFQYHWIYWLAPILGAITATFLFDYIRKGEVPKCVDTGVFGCIECEVYKKRGGRT